MAAKNLKSLKSAKKVKKHDSEEELYQIDAENLTDEDFDKLNDVIVEEKNIQDLFTEAKKFRSKKHKSLVRNCDDKNFVLDDG